MIDKLGTQIIINRGDNTGIAVGQTWSIYTLGDKLIDPATGQILGREEAEVGKVKIIRVMPTFSYGETVEGTGIVIGNFARPNQPAN